MLYLFVSCLFLCVLLLFVYFSRLFSRLKGVEKVLISNTPQVKYDVFVSFRGADIRRGFLSYLIDTFERRKIKAFVDDKNLRKGEEILPSLLTAIEGSSILLVIFSPDYASSRWCLLELVKIQECKEKYGRIVIPVFYDVEPADVRHQTGSYKNAFSKHETKHKTKVVQLWRHALTKCADLSGIESSKFLNDAEVIKDIVDRVLKKLVKPSINSKELVGIDEKVAEVESWIRKESKNTCLIGICGMGGIGKTTLAEEVFNKLQSEYEGSYFLAGERDQSIRHELTSLREILFSKLLGYDVKINTPNSLPEDIVRRICCMKVFIVLDDVNDSEHVDKLLGTVDNFGLGSTIIITTRDEQVLRANKVNNTYQLRELSSNKALELFNLYVFRQSDHRREYNELSKRVVDYAKGNPLVVKVLARDLHGKSKEDWEGMLDKLKKMPPTKEVYEVMKLSYDGLDRKGQQIFLDLACFFLRTHVPVNVDYLKSLFKDNESDNSAAFELGRLKDKALINFSENNIVSMHDSVQEMAWEIVRQESIDSRGSRSRFWDPDDIYEALTNDKVTEAIRSIRIQLATIKEQKLMPHVFAKMSKLRFLEISGNDDYGCYDKLILAADEIQFLRNELRFLCWYNYPLKSLPENFSGQKLVILKLRGSIIEKLWDGVKNLGNLKEVDLSWSKMLKELPDLSKATNLEVLILEGCSMLASVNPSIFSLRKLEKLDLRHCRLLTMLTSDSHLCSLSYLKLDGCENLRKFSIKSENMKELTLGWTKVKALTSSFGYQRKLQLLHLKGSAIESLPSSINNLTQLLHLDVSFCRELQTISELPLLLQTLDAQYCTSLQTLPKLPQFLETLNLKDCKSLMSLPELSLSLKTLNAQICTSLQILPELPQFLKTLDVYHSVSLKTLPELPPLLEILNVEGCRLLQTLPKLPSCLKILHAPFCSLVQTLPDLPPSLETLNATRCQSLKTALLFPSTAIEQLKENRRSVLFRNCLNLDEHSLVSIGLNAQINMMNFANHHLCTPNLHHVQNYNDYDVNHHSYQVVYLYPGSTIPKWLEYKTTKDYIIIDLSYATPSPQWGFIFCFVLHKHKDKTLIERLEFNITISDGEGEGEGKQDSVHMYVYYIGYQTDTDHLCVAYDQRCSAFLSSRAKHQKYFKLTVTMGARINGVSYNVLAKEVLKGFGVSPVSTFAYNSFIQKMKFRDSEYQFH